MSLLETTNKFLAEGESVHEAKECCKALVEAYIRLTERLERISSDRTARDPPKDSDKTVHQKLDRIIQTLEKPQRTTTNTLPPKPTWAHIAAGPGAIAQGTATASYKTKIRGRAPGLANASPQEVVIRTNSALGTGGAVAANRLRSGDVEVTWKTKEHKDRAERDERWVKEAFGEEASINPTLFTLVVTGMPLNRVRAAGKEAFESELRAVNGRSIYRATVSQKKVYTERGYAPVYVCFRDAGEAATACRRGIIWDYQTYTASALEPNAQVNRCFNCHKFGHIAKHCRERAACGFCASRAHTDRECQVRMTGGQAHCINCSGPHPAWTATCSEAQTRRQAALEALRNRPRIFASPPTPTPAPHKQTTIDWTTTEPRADRARSDDSPPHHSQNPPSAQTDQTWITIQPRGGRGLGRGGRGRGGSAPQPHRDQTAEAPNPATENRVHRERIHIFDSQESTDTAGTQPASTQQTIRPRRPGRPRGSRQAPVGNRRITEFTDLTSSEPRDDRSQTVRTPGMTPTISREITMS